MSLRLTLATRNEHKLREFAELVAPHELVALAPDVDLPPETGETFLANAAIKAAAARDAVGGDVFADDSGIEAVALGGRPGIRSARFAGEHATDEQNLAKLIAELEGVEDRRVAYVCALVVLTADGARHEIECRCEGTLTDRPRGTEGFGYDPAFIPTEGDGRRTMAELDQSEKDAISHRGAAARRLRELLDGRAR